MNQPIRGCPELQADPATAALIGRRLDDGEITCRELVDILAAPLHSKRVRSADGYSDVVVFPE